MRIPFILSLGFEKCPLFADAVNLSILCPVDQAFKNLKFLIRSRANKNMSRA